LFLEIIERFRVIGDVERLVIIELVGKCLDVGSVNEGW
jgi:hypothetical protein